MKIEFKNIPIYYINPDKYVERRDRMEDFLPTITCSHERIPSNDDNSLVCVRINKGLNKACKRGIEIDVYPFIILEDDATLIEELPEFINIPKEGMFIYLGASKYECGGLKPSMWLEEHNEEYYRIKHSLGTHARLILNKESALHYIEVNDKASEKNDYSDIYFAIDSGKELYMTPKDGPYFYQNDGHNEYITKFLWENVLDKYLVK